MLGHTAAEDWTQPKGGLCDVQTHSAWKRATSVEGAGIGWAVGKPQREAQLQGFHSWRALKGKASIVG